MMRSNEMNRKIHINKEKFEKIIDYSIQESASTDSHGMSMEKMSQLFDNRFKKKLTVQESNIVRPNRKMNKTYRISLMVASLAAVFTIAITGTLMNTIEPATQPTNPAVQQDNREEDFNSEVPGSSEQTVKNTTEKSVEYRKNDVNSVDKGEIVLIGGKNKSNYTNPTKISLSASGIHDDDCNWQIKEYKGTSTIHQGQGKTIKGELKEMLESGENGNFIITYSYSDKNGNEITLHKGFSIDSKEMQNK